MEEVANCGNRPDETVPRLAASHLDYFVSGN